MRVLPLLLALFLPSGAAPILQAGLSSETTLKIALKGPSVAFEGEQRSEVYLENGKAVGAVRVRGDGRGRIRREYTSGAAKGVVTIQTASTVWQRTDGKNWTRLPHIEDAVPEAAAALMKNYTVVVSPQESCLGRMAIPMKIVPRLKFNPSRRLWLDVKTGIILKDQLFAPDGRMRSSSTFTTLVQQSQSAALFQPPSSATEAELFGPASFSPRKSAAAVESETGRPVLLPAHVPSGYRIALYGVMKTGSGRKMPAVRYFDGLAAFTIFQRGMGAGMGGGPGFMGGRGRGMGRMGRGPMGGGCVTQSGLQQSVVAVSGERSNYLLVGDLAAYELERIAKSLP